MKIPAPLFILLALPHLMADEAPTLKLIAEVKGFASPESIAWDGTHYYVSNVGKELKPTAKDGDGFISRMDAKGDHLELNFIDKLNAPKGMVVVGKTLYVCDVDVLLGFDLDSKEKTVEISLAKDGVQLLNDVCAASAGKLLVSATDKNKVYVVDTEQKTFAEIGFDKAPSGPNGLLYAKGDDGAYLILVEWGRDNQPNGNLKGYRLDRTLLKATYEAAPEGFPVKDGYLDGIAVLCDDQGEPQSLLYSDWVALKPEGKLFWVGMDDPIIRTELTIPKGPPGGPADFFLEAKSAVLALPCMLEGRVLLLQLAPHE
ncbi:MAG: hypothetical protein NTW21_44425 [Verrucomicrobia bacterium]|nr:hypothetical protein [Verrucomicrobiota bacterium]